MQFFGRAKIILGTLSVLVALLSADLGAATNNLKPQLAISPSRIEINPDESRGAQSITVMNLGSESMRVEVSVQNWDFDENNRYRALPPTPQSLDQWLIINPVRLKIPPKGQQTVRMAVRPKAKPQDGEHRAMVFFRQISNQKKGVNVLFNVGVPVYAFFGEVKREATLHSLSFDEDRRELVFDLESTGNAYVRPEGVFMVVDATEKSSNEALLQRFNAKTGEITGEAAVASGKLSSKPVFAGERRRLRVAVPVEKGELPESYALAVKVDIAGKLFEHVYTIQPEK